MLATLIWAALAVAPTDLLQPVPAAPAPAAPTIDGRVDEAAWQAATPFTAFVESAPAPGAAPSEATEARVLYDHHDLYVSVICRHRDPARIVAGLGPRDQPPEGDRVTIGIDADRDGRSALTFTVTAGGVLEDSLLFEDRSEAASWDAVWDGASARRADGWSAEWRIPLRLLRFDAGAAPVFGFVIRRFVADGHRAIDSALIPREGNAVVSRFGALAPLTGVVPRHDLELAPYLAAGADGDVNPSLSVGADARASVGPVAIAVAINPDFGQVEGDDRVANFGTDELSRPEKRPFFNDGLELFQAAGADLAIAPQRLFYSRRIGIDRPILGAVKLTGHAGAVDAGGFAALVSDSRPLAMGDPAVTDDLTQAYAAAVAKLAAGDTAHLGATATAAVPVRVACAGDGCAPLGEATGGLDFDVQSDDRAWGVIGQVIGSAITDGPAGGQVLRDGTHLDAGDLGLGALVNAGKLGGAPWRFDVRYAAMSPHLDLNAMGFLPVQGQQQVRIAAAVVQPDGIGALRSLEVGTRHKAYLGFDGELLGIYDLIYGDVILPGFVHLNCDAGFGHHLRDRREVAEAGVGFERPSFDFVECSGDTDATRALVATASFFWGRSNDAASSRGHSGTAATASVTWRPAAAIESAITVDTQTYVDGPRWISTTGEVARVAAEDPRSLALTLRQRVVMTPTLSLQGRATLYTERVRYGQVFDAPLDDDHLDLDELMAIDASEPSRHAAALDVNASLRWDYRPGGALFVTYARGQEEAAGMTSGGLGVGELFAAPARHQLLVKLSYFWGT